MTIPYYNNKYIIVNEIVTPDLPLESLVSIVNHSLSPLYCLVRQWRIVSRHYYKNSETIIQDIFKQKLRDVASYLSIECGSLNFTSLRDLLKQRHYLTIKSYLHDKQTLVERKLLIYPLFFFLHRALSEEIDDEGFQESITQIKHLLLFKCLPSSPLPSPTPPSSLFDSIVRSVQGLLQPQLQQPPRVSSPPSPLSYVCDQATEILRSNNDTKREMGGKRLECVLLLLLKSDLDPNASESLTSPLLQLLQIQPLIFEDQPIHIRLVSLLLENGADPCWKKNPNRESPWEFVQRRYPIMVPVFSRYVPS
jgi:hypothetical protein